MAGVYKGLNIKFAADTSGLNKALSEIDSRGRKLSSNLKQIEKALKVDPKNTELLRQKFEGLGDQVKHTEERLRTLRQAESEIGKGGMSTDEWNKLQREIAGTEASLKTYQKQLKEANAQYAAATSSLGQIGSKISEIGQTLTPVGEQLQSFGGKMTATLTTAAVAAGTASVKMAVDFETSLAKVSTLMDESVMSVEEMGEGARKLATEYGVSATEINEALYQAQSASVDTAKALEFVGEATKLSKAGFTDSATAVDTLTTAINAYGMSADDAAHISDVLVNTQNLGKTTVNELGSSMGQVIPTAAAYNVSLENLASAYVVMTKQGINTAGATTALNGMLNELADSSGGVGEILKEKTGKSFGELMREGQSLGDVLSVLYDTVDGDSEAFAQLFSNIRAQKGALAIANGGAEQFNETLDSMVDSAGVVDAAFAKMGDTTQAQFNKMKAQVEDAAISIGQALIPVVRDVIGAVSDFAEAFNSMSEDEKRAAVSTAAFIAGLGPAITLLGTLMVSVERVGSGVMSFAQLLAKLDMATGGAKNGIKQVADASGKMTTQVTKASVAMGALKAGAAMAAVAGVVVLVKAIKDYVEEQQRFQKATDGLRDATKMLDGPLSDQAGALDAVSGSMGDYIVEADRIIESNVKLAESIEATAAKTLEDASVTQYWSDRVKAAKEAYDGSADALAELEAAVDGYNNATGSSIEITDEETGKLSVSTDELQRNTDAWIANAKAKAAQELLSEAIKDQVEAEMALQEAHQAVAYAQESYNQAVKDGDEAMINYYRGVLAETETAEKKLEAGYEARRDAVEKLEEQYNGYTKEAIIAAQTTDDFRNAIEHAEDEASEFDKLAGNLKKDANDLSTEMKEAGLSAQDFGRIGADAFELLYQQSGQDMSKVRENIDMLDRCGINPKELHVTDNGTIEDEKGRVIDLDNQTIDGKQFSVEADTSQAESALSRVLSGLSSIVSKTVDVVINKKEVEAAGGFYKLHASGGFITNGVTYLGRDRFGIGHIAGEAGREWIMGHADGTTSIVPIENKRYLKPYAQEIASMIGGGNSTMNSYDYHITVNASGDGDDIARQVTKAIRAQELMRGRR